MVRVRDVSRVMVERRQRAYDATHDCHGVSVTTEAIEERSNLLMHHGVVCHHVHEGFFLLSVRQLAV